MRPRGPAKVADSASLTTQLPTTQLPTTQALRAKGGTPVGVVKQAGNTAEQLRIRSLCVTFLCVQYSAYALLRRYATGMRACYLVITHATPRACEHGQRHPTPRPCGHHCPGGPHACSGLPYGHERREERGEPPPLGCRGYAALAFAPGPIQSRRFHRPRPSSIQACSRRAGAQPRSSAERHRPTRLRHCPSSAPAPLQGAPGGSGRRGTPRGAMGGEAGPLGAPRRCLVCSRLPPPKPPFPPVLAVATGVGEALKFAISLGMMAANEEGSESPKGPLLTRLSWLLSNSVKMAVPAGIYLAMNMLGNGAAKVFTAPSAHRRWPPYRAWGLPRA